MKTCKTREEEGSEEGEEEHEKVKGITRKRKRQKTPERRLTCQLSAALSKVCTSVCLPKESTMPRCKVFSCLTGIAPAVRRFFFASHDHVVFLFACSDFSHVFLQTMHFFAARGTTTWFCLCLRFSSISFAFRWRCLTLCPVFGPLKGSAGGFAG